ncbi:MAG: threonine synthase [Chitinophagales bacterium]|nr:threonine synthase [Chitinophagales bacterium]
MKYYSTNRQSPEVDFREATIKGQAPDKGLYFPTQIPQFEKSFLQDIPLLSKAEIAFRVIKPYVGDTINEEALHRICTETVDFDFPLVKITDSIYSLELFHGPTLAFKDAGARFMSRCLGYFSQNSDKEVTVLVATSGDTGSAVANGFLGVKGVKVVILYPSGKVSAIQEKQLTTLGQNITALEVNGTFDDCQQMVKQAFSDEELNQKLFLTSANSINVARWLPQQFYYLFALQQWHEAQPPVICVPSGNFGNICAGLLAHLSGMPAAHFVAACNRNNVFTRFLQSGNFEPHSAVATLSNAMDVGVPSNFVRLIEMFGTNVGEIRETISSYSISDEETIAAIQHVYKNYGYLCDPHGAVGFASLEKYLEEHPAQKGIFLETAHPCKFVDVVENALNIRIDLPESVKGVVKREKQSIRMDAGYENLKDFLWS